MPIDPKFVVVVGSAITGRTLALARRANDNDIRAVVARLQFDHLDPGGREMRVGDHGSVRLDRQGNPTGGGTNLQVQLNGVPPPSTVGQVLVPAAVFTRTKANGKPNVTEHLASRARSALIESCRDGLSRTVT